MTFPSNCQVYRSHERDRYVVTVFGYGSGCVATGATGEEAEEKAQRWTRANLRGNGVMGAIGTLDLELTRLCAVLASLSTDCE